jgi:peptidylprolyl isomerase
MTSRRRALSLKTALTTFLSTAVVAAALVGCSSSSGSSSSDQSAAASALASAAVTGAPSEAAPASSAPAASNGVTDPSIPFVTTDCAVGEPVPSAEAPAGGTTFGSVNVLIADTGVPTIAIGADAQNATELGIEDLVEGTGPAVMAGDTLTVNYCGVGMQSRQMFDSSWTRGEPISFPLDGLIQGWIQGLPGMKVGGQRLLVIPGDLGYGPQGQGTILPNETLVFVVELVSIP